MSSPPVRSASRTFTKKASRFAMRLTTNFLLPLLLISIVTFYLIRIASGDIALLVLGREAAADQLEAFRESHGLNLPLYEQYWNWLTSSLAGDFGNDPLTGLPVLDVLLPALGRTMLLALVCIVISPILSMYLGLWSALRQGRLTDRTILTFNIVLVGIPEFIIALIGILIFGVWLGILPMTSSAFTMPSSFGDKVLAMILPALPVIASLTSHMYRIARSSCLDVLQMSYYQSARLRGVSTFTLHHKYIMRNALPPLVNSIAISALWLTGGVVIVESIFAYPGLGRLLVDSVGSGRVDVVQAIVIGLAGLFLVIANIADGTVRILNRPLTYGREQS